MHRRSSPVQSPRRPGQCIAVVFGGMVLSVALTSPQAMAAEYVPIPSGQFMSTLSGPPDYAPVVISQFAMRATPVSNAEFLAFVQTHPEWQRDRIPATFADASYLHRWAAPSVLGATIRPEQAVTSVSWFAAEAFCETEHARLPTWYEWEYVAAADKMRPDARRDPNWLAHILNWYGSKNEPASIGGAPNFYGVRDLHGVIWEWVDDFNSLLISADSRNQGDPDKLKFCGAGAISLQDKENYAVLMRVALLSSLAGADTTNDLGFRCVRDGSSPIQ